MENSYFFQMVLINISYFRNSVSYQQSVFFCFFFVLKIVSALFFSLLPNVNHIIFCNVTDIIMGDFLSFCYDSYGHRHIRPMKFLMFYKFATDAVKIDCPAFGEHCLSATCIFSGKSIGIFTVICISRTDEFFPDDKHVVTPVFKKNLKI